MTKRYQNLIAVKDINFTVYRGECFGLLGPNGAGKTTTVRMITCLSPITEGHLEVLGMDVKSRQREIKAHLGILPQEDNLDGELSALENLTVYARFFGLSREEAKRRAVSLLHFVGLADKARSPAETLSGGMKRRLLLARSLINNPELLILDEPTTGLDPEARQLVWQKLRQLKMSGVTLILTTHYMEEAASLCDRLAIMNEGQILEIGTPHELVTGHIGKEVLELVLNNQQQLDELKLQGLNGHQKLGEIIFLYTDDARSLWQQLKDYHGKIIYHRTRPATLEDVFLKLTGKGLSA